MPPQLLIHRSHCPPLPYISKCSMSWSVNRSPLQNFPGKFITLPRRRPRIISTGERDCYNNRTTIRCMANPRRVKMVAKQIRRELSDMLLTDKVLQYAVLPEASLGADRYLSSLTTITDVEVSSDLQVVKVYVSVFGDERGKEVALSGLKSKAKYIRGQLGRRMKLRLTPEIRFIEDESFERGSRVLAILDRIKSENEEELAETEENESSDQNDRDRDMDEDDLDDDGIIYVR